MGNINTTKNLILQISNSIGIYTLICEEDGLHKVYNLFVDINDDNLILTIMSLQNDKSYSTEVELNIFKRMDLFSQSANINHIKSVIEASLIDKALRVEENHSNIRLIFFTMKGDKVEYFIFDPKVNNSSKKQDISVISSNPLLESFISGDNIEAYLTENSWLKIIIKLFNDGKYEDALKVIGEEEKDVIYLYFKGLCQFKLENYVDALFTLNNLSNKVEVDLSVYINKCKTDLKGKEYVLREEALRLSDKDKKIECLNIAVKINPAYDIAYDDKGVVLLNMGKPEEAINCFNKAIELNPTRILAYKHKGLALMTLKNYDEAIECFDKACDNYEKELCSVI
jgi:tetratricopeptide (TPR) repeat protein